MPGRVAVILFSHGSLLCGSGVALENRARLLSALGDFVAVEPGYLNYSQPSIEDAIARCRAAGAERIIIVPFFLVAGKFVRTDLPARLASIGGITDAEVVLARAIEDASGLEALVLDLLQKGEDPATWQRRAMQGARDLCEKRESCPLYGSAVCKAGGGSDTVGGDAFAAPEQDVAVAFSGRSAEKRGLLMILHGSPRPAANQPALDMAQSIRTQRRFDYVEVAYLECNEPPVAPALMQAAEAGVTHLDVLPYFLHPGRHMVLDVANHLIESEKRSPGMRIALCPAIGEAEGLTEILLFRANEAAMPLS